jgi:hypothetical protein
LNSEIRKKYHEALKKYKDTLKHKKEIFHEKKLQDLEIAAETDPNSFWKNLKNTSDSCDDLSSSSSQITNQEWISHFENLHRLQNIT